MIAACSAPIAAGTQAPAVTPSASHASTCVDRIDIEATPTSSYADIEATPEPASAATKGDEMVLVTKQRATQRA